MSDLLFDRSVRVTVEDVEISALRVTFRIEKTLDSKPNKISVSICNLSDETRNRITKPRVKLKVEAGYQDRLALLFDGDILGGGIEHFKNGREWVTKIEAGDGAEALRTSHVSESFNAGAKLTDILQKLAGGFGINADKAKQRIARGDFRGGLTEFVNGFTSSGQLQHEFDRMMRTAGLGWSIQNRELQVLGPDETTQETALKIGSGSGLIGSPERGDKGAIKFRCLIQAGIAPGRKIELDSRTLKETIGATNVTFDGDSTAGGPWFAIVTGKKAA